MYNYPIKCEIYKGGVGKNIVGIPKHKHFSDIRYSLIFKFDVYRGRKNERGFK